jgi:N12 class adenine-specific DNA methylase
MKDADFQDAQDHLDSAKRHARKWDLRPSSSSPEEDAAAHADLVHAHGALERLASAVEILRAETANALLERQTDQADTLNEFFGTVVGDREYGFNPDAKPAGGAS